MKILHITATHLHKYGGIPVVLKKLIHFQNKIEGVQSIGLSVRNDIKDFESDSFVFEQQLDKINIFIREFNPDVTIFHGLYFKEYPKIAKLLTKLQLKYYIEPHSSFMKSGQQKGKLKKLIANKTLFYSFIKKAYGYIFLNESEMSNSIFKTKNDVIIPNGIDVSNFRIEKEKSKKVKIYYIGRIDIHHKGLDLLLESLKVLDDKERGFSLDIFGTGSKDAINQIQNYVDQFKNLSIEFKGPIYDKEKEEMLKNYNIMVLTSRYEGFPMTVLEALSFGNPCIVTDGTNVRGMIESNGIGWGTDNKDISKTILTAVEEYKKDQSVFITRSSEFVSENYSWENISKISINKLR